MLLGRIARTRGKDAAYCYSCAMSVCLSVGHNRETCKTAEQTDIPLGLWNRVDPRYHVLGGVPDPPGKIEILGEHFKV